MDVLLWVENLEAAECVLIQAGHCRQLAEHSPAISTRLFSEAKSTGSWRFHLLSHSLHSVSFSSCLPSMQQWLLTALSQWHSSIRKIGTMTPRPAGTTAGVAWLLATGLMVEILLTPTPPQKNLTDTLHQVWKWDLQTDVTLCSFWSFLFPSVSYSFPLLTSSGSSERSPQHKQTTKAAESQTFDGHCGVGVWPLLPTWCIYPSVRLLLVYMPSSSDSHTAFQVVVNMFDVSCCSHPNSVMDLVVCCLSSPTSCHSYRRFSDPMRLKETKQKPRALIVLKDTETWSQQRPFVIFIQI